MASGRRSKKGSFLNVKNKNWKNLFLYTIIFVAAVAVFAVLGNPSTGTNKQIPLSQGIADVRAGKVNQIEAFDTKLIFHEKSGTFESSKESGTDVYTLFNNARVSLAKTKVVVNDE